MDFTKKNDEIMHLYREIQCLEVYINNKEFFFAISNAYEKYLEEGRIECIEGIQSILKENSIDDLDNKVNRLLDLLNGKEKAEEKLSDIEEKALPWVNLPLPNVHHLVDKSHLSSKGELNSGTYQLKISEEQNFILYKPLGRGNFGTVWLAQNTKTLDWCVIKEQEINEINSEENIKHEYTVLKKLKKSTFLCKNENKIFFDMELQHGICLDSKSRPLLSRKLDPDDILTYLIDYVYEEQDLLKNGFVHRDHKGENQIFNIVKQKNRRKMSIIDVGFAKETKKNNVATLQNIAGTKEYIPPEIINIKNFDEKYEYGEAQEVCNMGFAMADSLGFLYSKKIPSRIKNTDEIKLNHPLPKSLIKDLLPILQQMTKEKSEERLKLTEIVSKLQSIQNKYFWIRAQVKNVAVVKLTDLVLKVDGKYNAVDPNIVLALKSLDELVILDPANEINNPNKINIRKIIESIHKETGISFNAVLGNQEDIKDVIFLVIMMQLLVL